MEVRKIEIFRLLGTIAVDTNQAEKALDDTAEKAENTGNQSSSAFQKIGSAAATIGKAVVGAGVALGGAWLAAIEGSREYRTEMGKLDTAFVSNGHSSEVARKTYSDLNAVLGDSGQATEAAQHLAKLTDNEKDLQTWTDICTGVFATFGESLPIESLTESSNEVAKSGVLTGGLVDALVWAGINEEEFQAKLDKCTGEQERQNLIMNTLNGTYKNASTQYQETNKDIIAANKAQERLTNAFSEFGRVGEPILTAIKNAIAKMVSAAVPKLESLIQKVKEAKKWIKDNKNTVDGWVAAIIGATVGVAAFLLVMKWSAIMTAAKNAIAAVRTAILLFNAALLANPIALVVGLIAGLVAAFVYLWNNNKSFRQFWIDLWNKIKSACNTAITGIKNKFNDLKTAASNVKKWFEDIRKGIADKIESAQKTVKKAIDKIKGFFPLSIGKIFSNLKIPKISVSGGKAPFGIAGKGKLPSFDVKWNAQGAVLTKPTIFGMAPSGQLLGGGEAGPEAVAPITVLQDYISAAVQRENQVIGRILIEQMQMMMDFLRQYMPNAVVLDSGALVGELLPAIDVGLSNRLAHAVRGNTR